MITFETFQLTAMYTYNNPLAIIRNYKEGSATYFTSCLGDARWFLGAGIIFYHLLSVNIFKNDWCIYTLVSIFEGFCRGVYRNFIRLVKEFKNGFQIVNECKWFACIVSASVSLGLIEACVIWTLDSFMFINIPPQFIKIVGNIAVIRSLV